MIIASLILNILVLVPVCLALIGDFKKMKKVAGIVTPARGILLAMYLTILITSFLLLFFQQPLVTFTLFSFQIVYKILSPFTVKSIKNPIVISNLFIALFHLFTVVIMLKSGILEF
ncbi:hypothetical protein [Algoriphagus sp.]|uniref:hypothetical protein n=1 Tax=Algoriphagus sp. TaxID=1872435 RepID=UPI00261517CE|nr:hypothetical protein [Algoriphagus sp.]